MNGVVVTQPPHTRAPSVEKPWQREGRVPGVAALMVQRHWMDPDAIPETLAEHQLACAGAEREIACTQSRRDWQRRWMPTYLAAPFVQAWPPASPAA